MMVHVTWYMIVRKRILIGSISYTKHLPDIYQVIYHGGSGGIYKNAHFCT